MSPTDNFLKTSDCELEPANKYPGRKHRRNPTGSEFEFKEQWIENEVVKWVLEMKQLPKYEETPISQKTYCLRYHLRKLSVASSECRKLLINVEARTTQNPDNNIPIVENMDMDPPPVTNDEDAMEIENVGSQDMFTDEEENNENMSVTMKEKLILEALERPVEHLIEDEETQIVYDQVTDTRR